MFQYITSGGGGGGETIVIKMLVWGHMPWVGLNLESFDYELRARTNTLQCSMNAQCTMKSCTNFRIARRWYYMFCVRSVMQSCLTEIRRNKTQGIIFLLKFDSQFQPMDKYFKWNSVHFYGRKTATQKIFCIAVISKMHSKLRCDTRKIIPWNIMLKHHAEIFSVKYVWNSRHLVIELLKKKWHQNYGITSPKTLDPSQTLKNSNPC